MALNHSYLFTKTIINWPAIEKATHNQYRVVSVRDYVDKKGRFPDGYTMTLMVIKDDYDYGVDRNGNPRESNLFCNFEVTVFSRSHSVKKGDYIKLINYDSENSYAIGYDLLLRFKDFEVINPNATVGKAHA